MDNLQGECGLLYAFGIPVLASRSCKLKKVDAFVSYVRAC